MMLKRLLPPLVVVVLLGALFAFGLLRGAPDRDIESALLGRPAPAFELPLYERYQPDFGTVLTSADLQGKALVVNFWASWCLPCYQEAPVLQAYWQEYQDADVVFVGIQTQDRDRLNEGRAFLSQFGLSFPNGIDNDSSISVDWGLFGVPETFFVDRDGRVIHKHAGPVTAELMDAKLRELLN